ncbi:sterol desaturase family protein [Neoroseomonas soli]|uniref:Sterol desaturase family protein n=1 Tax=Neoroseomonas soli TaxID=1081025 RepID=A0A9X9X509_9PROT|nr:sterol desaturase family protein [Neoroseomonas soli]MBR0674488.1 sterol desaturase family protein [Neoroseomonas soli]
MTWPAYDPLTAAWNWLVSLAGILTDPGSPFWWPTIAVAVLGIGVAAFATRRSLREARQEAIPRNRAEMWRQLPVDIGLTLVNSAIPFFAAPLLFLFSASGAAIGVALMLPIFGEPVEGMRLDHAGAMLLAALVPFVLGDFALYWTHRIFHRYPLLWRAHRLHHAPEVLTPFTAFRFWPQEQIVHMAGAAFMNGLGLGLVATALGGSVQPLTLLGVNVLSLAWNIGFAHLRHSHVALPFPRWLSYVLVSPHMHQVHHSVEERHHDRNFATVFAAWDWLFGSLYIPDPQERFRFGVDAPAPAPAAAALPAAPL